MMFLPGMDIEMRAAAALLLASGNVANAVDAVLHWRTVVRPEGYIPGDESSAVGGVVTEHALPFRALFDEVNLLTGFQRFLEVKTGDVFLDYLADLDLAGKEDLRVEVGGKYYVQKTASTALLESRDVLMDSGGIFKTLFLAPAG